MNRWVLLLRGVNVGGHGKLPMAALRDLLDQLGVRNVASYIQSGNLVFTGVIDAGAFERIVEDEIEAHFGFRPQALILSRESFSEILTGFPFDAARSDPKTGHIWYLSRPAGAPDLAALKRLAAPGERFALGAGAFYLYAPEGIGRSKLAAGVEGALGVPATARNLNTAIMLAELVEGLPAD